MNCRVSTCLAYAMAVYTMSSLYYLIRSKSVGTPFKDSLTIEQTLIKRKSGEIRRQIFTEGVLLSCIMFSVTRPFRNCS